MGRGRQRLGWGWAALGVVLWGAPLYGLSLGELVRRTERGEITSLPQALGAIPPSIRARFVLMERSRSLQEAAPEAPRVVMFDPQAQLTLSFNGSPQQRGYGTLEAIAYEPRTGAYELRHFDFTGPKPVVSAANPPLCLSCHRQLGRPNWEPFPHWPGALGDSPQWSSQEVQRLNQFATAAERHPLYGRLNWKEALLRARPGRSTPAFELSTRYTEQALARFPVVISLSPTFRKSPRWVAAALADCPQLPQQGEGWRQLHADMTRRTLRLPAPHRSLLSEATLRVMTHLRYLLDREGFSADWLPLSFTDRYFLTASSALIPQMLLRLPGASSQKPPWEALRSYYNPTQHPFTPALESRWRDYCERLVKGP